LNLPEGRPKAFRLTTQAKRDHVMSVAEKEDPRGQPYFWIGEGRNHWESDGQSDYQAVMDGCASVTPLHADMTNRAALEVLRAVEALPLGAKARVD
jgi:5'-nucleotidase